MGKRQTLKLTGYQEQTSYGLERNHDNSGEHSTDPHSGKVTGLTDGEETNRF